MAALAAFYGDCLGFARMGGAVPIAAAEMAVLGVAGLGRRQILRLGSQEMAIDQFEHAGCPYPDHGNAACLWFQHFAMVVPDMRAACARLGDVPAISLGGPHWLPESSGGVCAFKFRDPDGHPLELLQFPKGRVPAEWQGQADGAGGTALGIDHSAISVRDADRSIAFYAAKGLAAGARSLNEGPAQQSLDGLALVRVDVVPMMPLEAGMHLELLGYRVPAGEAGAALQANDAAATRLAWRGAQAGLCRDPDGHLHQIEADAS
jgi:catechol 2,3-dioxygenase-like lactoylglutathione lyase family enzyme